METLTATEITTKTSFIVDQKDLKSALSALSLIITPNPILPFFEQIRMELSEGNLILSARVETLSMSYTIPCTSLSNNASLFIDIYIIKKIVSKLKHQPLCLTALESELSLEAEEGIFYFETENDGAKPHEQTKNEPVIFDSNELKEALFCTIGRTTTDDLRPAMRGIAFIPSENGILIASTDAHQLSVYQTGAISSHPFILPETVAKIILARCSAGQVRLRVSNSSFFVKLGQMELWGNLITETYPDILGVFPEHTATFQLDLNELKRKLILSSITSNSHTSQVEFSISDGRIILKSEEYGSYKSSVSLPVSSQEGEVEDFALSHRKFAKSVGKIGGEAKFYFSGARRALAIKPVEKPNLRLLIMPLAV